MPSPREGLRRRPRARRSLRPTSRAWSIAVGGGFGWLAALAGTWWWATPALVAAVLPWERLGGRRNLDVRFERPVHTRWSIQLKPR